MPKKVVVPEVAERHILAAMKRCIQMWDELNALEKLVRKKTGDQDFEYSVERLGDLCASLSVPEDTARPEVLDYVRVELRLMFNRKETGDAEVA